MHVFDGKKTEFHFFLFPYFRVLPSTSALIRAQVEKRSGLRHQYLDRRELCCTVSATGECQSNSAHSRYEAQFPLIRSRMEVALSAGEGEGEKKRSCEEKRRGRFLLVMQLLHFSHHSHVRLSTDPHSRKG